MLAEGGVGGGGVSYLTGCQSHISRMPGAPYHQDPRARNIVRRGIFSKLEHLITGRLSQGCMPRAIQGPPSSHMHCSHLSGSRCGMLGGRRHSIDGDLVR